MWSLAASKHLRGPVTENILAWWPFMCNIWNLAIMGFIFGSNVDEYVEAIPRMTNWPMSGTDSRRFHSSCDLSTTDRLVYLDTSLSVSLIKLILNALIGRGPVWMIFPFEYKSYINMLVEERRNSIANALELRLSCTYPPTCQWQYENPIRNLKTRNIVLLKNKNIYCQPTHTWNDI